MASREDLRERPHRVAEALASQNQEEQSSAAALISKFLGRHILSIEAMGVVKTVLRMEGNPEAQARAAEIINDALASDHSDPQSLARRVCLGLISNSLSGRLGKTLQEQVITRVVVPCLRDKDVSRIVLEAIAKNPDPIICAWAQLIEASPSSRQTRLIVEWLNENESLLPDSAVMAAARSIARWKIRLEGIDPFDEDKRALRNMRDDVAILLRNARASEGATTAGRIFIHKTLHRKAMNDAGIAYGNTLRRIKMR